MTNCCYQKSCNPNHLNYARIKSILLVILVCLNSPIIKTVHTFLDVGPYSNLLYTPPPNLLPDISLTNETANTSAIRGIPKSIVYDSSGHAIIITESTDRICSQNLQGIELNVFQINKQSFKQVICDDSTSIQALASVSDPSNPGVFVAYLVNETPAFINIDRFDLSSSQLTNILVMNQTDTDPFTLSAVTLRSTNGVNTTRLYAAGNEIVWFLDYAPGQPSSGAEVALMYPPTTSVYAMTATILSNSLVGDAQQDLGVRMYALIQSDRAFYLHMQDGINPDLNVFDVDLNMTTSASRVYQSLVTPYLVPDNTPKLLIPSQPMKRGLHVCGDIVFLMYTRPRELALFARSFSALDLTPVGPERRIMPISPAETNSDLDLVLDWSCDRAGGNLVLLSQTTSPRVESLIYVAPDLRIRTVQQFGDIVKLANSRSIKIRRIGLAMGQDTESQLSLVTMLQAQFAPTRPDLLDEQGTNSSKELLVGAMASIGCRQLDTSSQIKPIGGVYACSSCTDTVGTKLSEIGGGGESQCLFYQQNPDTRSISNTICSPPNYLDKISNVCRYCAGESNGVTCIPNVQQADTQHTGTDQFSQGAHNDTFMVISVVGITGVMMAAFGGLMYHQHSVVKSRIPTRPGSLTLQDMIAVKAASSACYGTVPISRHVGGGSIKSISKHVGGGSIQSISKHVGGGSIKSDSSQASTLVGSDIQSRSNRIAGSNQSSTSIHDSPNIPNEPELPLPPPSTRQIQWVPPPPPPTALSTPPPPSSARSTLIGPHSRSNTGCSTTENTLFHPDHLPTMPSSRSVPVNLHALQHGMPVVQSNQMSRFSAASSTHTLSRSVPSTMKGLAQNPTCLADNGTPRPPPRKRSMSILVYNELCTKKPSKNPYGPWATKEMMESGILGALPVPSHASMPPIPVLSHVSMPPLPPVLNRSTNLVHNQTSSIGGCHDHQHQSYLDPNLSFVQIDSAHNHLFNVIPDQEDISVIMGSSSDSSMLSIWPQHN